MNIETALLKQTLPLLLVAAVLLFATPTAFAQDCDSEAISPSIPLSNSVLWSDWAAVPDMDRIYGIRLPQGVNCEVEAQGNQYRSRNCPKGSMARVRGITRDCAANPQHPSCACLE